VRKAFVLFFVIGTLSAESIAACDIVDKQEIQVGGHEGVSGSCPNNGLTIQCVRDGEGADSFTCNGPEGNFDGSDLQDLISTACGCGANSDDGAQDQLQQELGK
jgi:hypothetical protein